MNRNSPDVLVEIHINTLTPNFKRDRWDRYYQSEFWLKTRRYPKRLTQVNIDGLNPVVCFARSRSGPEKPINNAEKPTKTSCFLLKYVELICIFFNWAFGPERDIGPSAPKGLISMSN